MPSSIIAPHPRSSLHPIKVWFNFIFHFNFSFLCFNSCLQEKFLDLRDKGCNLLGMVVIVDLWSARFFNSFFLLVLTLWTALPLLFASQLHQVTFFSFDFDFDHFFFSISLYFISNSPFMLSASSQILCSVTSLVSGNFYLSIISLQSMLWILWILWIWFTEHYCFWNIVYRVFYIVCCGFDLLEHYCLWNIVYRVLYDCLCMLC